MISCASISGGDSMLQGFPSLSQFKEIVGKKMTRKAKRPSLKKDIVKHWDYWFLTPTVTFIGALLLSFFEIITEDNEHNYTILRWIGSYLAGSILLASLCTCWYHFIAEKKYKTSLKDNFVRFFLFISSAAWTPVLIIALDEQKAVSFLDGTKIFISPFLLSSLLSLGVVSYDYIG